METLPQEQETFNQPHPRIQLRIALLEYLALFDDPILKALQGSGANILEVASVWVELGLLVSQTRCNAIERGYSLEEAIAKGEARALEFAERLKLHIQQGAQ